MPFDRTELPDLPDLPDLPWQDIGASVIVVLLAVVVRRLSVRKIRGQAETLSPVQRKWISAVRNATVIFVLVSLLLIWALEISRFALSITAFAVAIAIGGKELILCTLGGLYRSLARPFDTGDWIEIGSYCGEVLGANVLGVDLQELSDENGRYLEYTGRTITLPNSLLLSQGVVNLNQTRHFFNHEFTLTLPLEAVNASENLNFLRDELMSAWLEYEDLALRYWDWARRRTGVDLGHPAPRVAIGTSDLGQVTFHARIFCRRSDAVDLETRISAAFLQHVTSAGGSSPEATGAAPGQFLRTDAGPGRPRASVDASKVLRQLALFQPLTDDERDRLARDALQHLFHPGDKIINKGDQGESMFVVISGVVDVSRKLADGEVLDLARLGSQQIFGEMSLLTGEPRSATVVARTECLVLEIVKASIEPILEMRPELAEDIAAVMAERKMKSELLTAEAREGTVTDRLRGYSRKFADSIRAFFRD